MKSMMTIQEAASLWQITTTQVTRYCRQKRIPGALLSLLTCAGRLQDMMIKKCITM